VTRWRHAGDDDRVRHLGHGYRESHRGIPKGLKLVVRSASANLKSSVREVAMTETLVLSAGHQLRDQAGALADAVVACEFARHPMLRTRYGAAGRTKSRQDAVYHLLHLADALDANSPALFNDYIGWAKVLLQHFGVSSEDLDRHLECMADVVRKQMPPPVAASAVAMIDGARTALPAMPSTTASVLDPGQRLSPLAREYVRTMLGGYRQAARQLVFDAADRGEPVRQLYLQVFQPALREIGRLWQTRKISVAQEHFCSAATQIVMSQLLLRVPAAQRCGRGVVVACVSGDLHELGARMVGDFFEMAGWDAYFCGANTPHAAVVQSVVERAADVLAVSATMGYHLHAVQDLIELVRADPRCARLRVMVGGHPFTVDPTLWRTLGADGTAADADAAVALAGQWLAGPASAP
jgi:MerR family transcriptional regulator, light-induced transcriptional regulator